jgi:hypothetical protein
VGTGVRRKIVRQNENRSPAFTMMQRILRKINSNTTKQARRRGKTMPPAGDLPIGVAFAMYW